MKKLARIVTAALVGASICLAAPAVLAQAATPPIEKSWNAPSYKMLSQAITDEIMATQGRRDWQKSNRFGVVLLASASVLGMGLVALIDLVPMIRSLLT